MLRRVTRPKPRLWRATNAQELHFVFVSPDPITDIKKTLDFDVVVVGAGVTGNSCCPGLQGLALAALIRRSYRNFPGKYGK